MHTLLNQYWDYLRIERQVSPHTLTNYQHQLNAILAILAEKGIHALAASKSKRGSSYFGRKS